jgi:hypothetical protein
MNYATATLADVPAIVQEIKALREVAKRSEVKTTKTQSGILRQLTPEVLTAVALELSKPSIVEAK